MRFSDLVIRVEVKSELLVKSKGESLIVLIQSILYVNVYV